MKYGQENAFNAKTNLIASLLIFGSAVDLRGATLQTLASFPGSTDGAQPSTSLIQIGNSLYGAAYSGGTDYAGTVFRLNPVDGTTSTVFSFTGGADGAGPNSLAKIGQSLFGTTAVSNDIDGPQGYGSVFRIDPASGKQTTLHTFSGGADGGDPDSLIALGSVLYGTAAHGGAYGGGVLYKIDPYTGIETVLHSFGAAGDGAIPQANLLAVAGVLYGTTGTGGANNAGTLFRIDPVSGQETILHNFVNLHDASYGRLARVGRYLYGLTQKGGLHNRGALIALNYATGAEKVVYSFTGGADGASPLGGLVLAGANLYGISGVTATTGGTIFSIDPATHVFSTLFIFPKKNAVFLDGALSSTAPSVINGLLYSTNLLGGSANVGTVFSFALNSKTFRLLHNFVGIGPGQRGNAGLTKSHGLLYSTTYQGGSAGLGSVVQVDPQTGAMTTLHEFKGGSDGYAPDVSLSANGNLLYGATTGSNEATNHGTIFSVDVRDGTFTTLNDLSTEHAAQAVPNSAVTDLGGLLYGTSYSNKNTFGTIFEVPSVPSSTGRNLSLQEIGGATTSALTPYKGSLYGTTIFPVYGSGQLFKLDPVTFKLSILHSFGGGNDGIAPASGVVERNGHFYGTTLRGGSTGLGIIFDIDPATGSETILHTFAGGSDGAYGGNLIVAGNKLYGTSGGGTASHGTIFVLDTLTGAKTTLYNFPGGHDGADPTGQLVQLGGAIYGTTSSGGGANRGTVFKLTP